MKNVKNILRLAAHITSDESRRYEVERYGVYIYSTARTGFHMAYTADWSAARRVDTRPRPSQECADRTNFTPPLGRNSRKRSVRIVRSAAFNRERSVESLLAHGLG